MRTHFSPTQLQNPVTREVEQQLRTCVHCGICTATCPTYLLLGDELDGPRGRIQLIQHMLEQDTRPTRVVTEHLDRCLSCLACTSACPSGVKYGTLIDEARSHIEEKAVRAWPDVLFRKLLGTILPRRWLFGVLALIARQIPWPQSLLPGRLARMRQLAIRMPARRHVERRRVSAEASAETVIVHKGCVQETVSPQITAMTVNVLERLGYRVVLVEGEGCCGALNHHLSQRQAASRRTKALTRDIKTKARQSPVSYVITTATGCEAHIKVETAMLETETGTPFPRTIGIMEFLRQKKSLLPSVTDKRRIVVHQPCTQLHALRLADPATEVLSQMGFDVTASADQSCCGSAGVYNALEPELSERLGQQKIQALQQHQPGVVVTTNIGCLTQIHALSNVPVLHPIELVHDAMFGK